MKNFRKLLALLLSLVMCLSFLPEVAFADCGTIMMAEPVEVTADSQEGEGEQGGIIQIIEGPEEEEAPSIEKDDGMILLPEEEDNAESFEAKVPDIHSEISKENALAILKAYDADGYYVVDTVLQQGRDQIDYYLSGSRSNAEGLDTVVHECVHTYSGLGGFYGDLIYIGNQRAIDVWFDTSITIPETSTWAETLPDDLRTFRFNTYVSEGSNTSANVYGPYGLLNEFMAYCTGMRDQLTLFPYYKAQENSLDTWRCFINSCTNDRQAYAEFRFWTLGYLDYMKTNNKEVYDSFMANKNYLDAYLTIKELFESQIEEYDSRCDQIIKLAAAAGINARFEDFSGDVYFWFGNTGIGTNYTQYAKLMKELSKSKYQKIEQTIMAGGRSHTTPEAPVLNAVANSGTGVRIVWSAVDEAIKYKVYRKASGGSWEPLKTVNGTNYTDTSAQMGTKYAYRVMAYNGSKWGDYSDAMAITFNPFTDVSSSDTIFKYVSWAYNNGVVTGTSETTFSPGNTCTRIQFVMMLWKMHGSPDVNGKNPFTDVESGTKKEKAVLWALDEGIINSGLTFNPSGSITRINIVMILWKLAGSPKASGTNPFTDVSGAKTINAVLWAYNNSITKGTSATTFSPNKNCTRGQLVTFLYKYNNIYSVI